MKLEINCPKILGGLQVSEEVLCGCHPHLPLPKGKPRVGGGKASWTLHPESQPNSFSLSLSPPAVRSAPLSDYQIGIQME